jgi:hypothetical protein
MPETALKDVSIPTPSPKNWRDLKVRRSFTPKDLLTLGGPKKKLFGSLKSKNTSGGLIDTAQSEDLDSDDDANSLRIAAAKIVKAGKNINPRENSSHGS